MSVFVDANVLVYARDTSEAGKHERARAWLDHVWHARTGRLSYQVLQEFYVTVTQKLSPGLPSRVARADVQNLLAWRPLVVHAGVVEGAWLIEDRYGLSFWDALIVSAAQVSKCERLLTEDLQDGADYGGVIVADPFRHEPGAT